MQYPTELDRIEIINLIDKYFFQSIESNGLETLQEKLTDEAKLTIQTSHDYFYGRSAIIRYFEDMLKKCSDISFSSPIYTVDEKNGRVAAGITVEFCGQPGVNKKFIDTYFFRIRNCKIQDIHVYVSVPF